MIITHVSVTIGLTQNLGDYSNVRPEVQISAQVLPTDNAVEVIADLQSHALAQVYAAADTLIERHGKPAVYSEMPRFALAANSPEKLGFILSVAQIAAFREARPGYTIFFENNRYMQLHKLIGERFPDFRVVEMQHAENFEEIPKLDRLGLYRADTCHIVVFCDMPEKLPRHIQEACYYTHAGYCDLQRYIDRLPNDRPILIFDGSAESLEDIQKYFPPHPDPVGGDPEQFPFDPEQFPFDDDDDDDDDDDED